MIHLLPPLPLLAHGSLMLVFMKLKVSCRGVKIKVLGVQLYKEVNFEALWYNYHHLVLPLSWMISLMTSY